MSPDEQNCQSGSINGPDLMHPNNDVPCVSPWCPGKPSILEAGDQQLLYTKIFVVSGCYDSDLLHFHM